MCHLLKIADIDLSFITVDNMRIVLTAKESEHGYDYDVACYSDSVDPIEVIEEHHLFYDRPTADAAADFMTAKIKEILS